MKTSGRKWACSLDLDWLHKRKCTKPGSCFNDSAIPHKEDGFELCVSCCGPVSEQAVQCMNICFYRWHRLGLKPLWCVSGHVSAAWPCRCRWTLKWVTVELQLSRELDFCRLLVPRWEGHLPSPIKHTSVWIGGPLIIYPGWKDWKRCHKYKPQLFYMYVARIMQDVITDTWHRQCRQTLTATWGRLK